MIIDRIENWSKYSNAPAWRRAFDYLLALTPDSPEGEMTPIAGKDVMARVMSYATRPPEPGTVEAHNQYVDIQMSLAGREAIDWFPRATLEIETPYDPAEDAALFHRPGPSPVPGYQRARPIHGPVPPRRAHAGAYGRGQAGNGKEGGGEGPRRPARRLSAVVCAII